ncbi:hypothetical protein L484_013433 [Morus notabilis]|uniref:Uncharacterized protein n=1 Tax=Morus notabilis TaxID=981085 RepID=W9RKZ9_9ROSA|nr:hypothetical protein L484_013433 [Morus notabilis]
MELTPAGLVCDAFGGARSLTGRSQWSINRILFASSKNEVTTTAVVGVRRSLVTVATREERELKKSRSLIFGDIGGELSSKREKDREREMFGGEIMEVGNRGCGERERLGERSIR